MPRLLMAAVLMALLPGVTSADATDRRERWCTASHMRKVERQIGEMDSVAKRTRAEMYLAMSRVARENDDTRGCIRHMKAVREVLGF